MLNFWSFSLVIILGLAELVNGLKVPNNPHLPRPPPPPKNHKYCGLVGAICDICHKQFCLGA